MENFKEVAKKVLTKEVILYIIFGVLTTIVNLISFYVMNSLLKWNENVSNLIAILLAVLVAYATNKDLVFHSEAKTIKDRLIEFWKFILGRAFTMVIEWGGGWILFKLPIPKVVTKFVLIVIVIILNFFISKFFAFKKSNKSA